MSTPNEARFEELVTRLGPRVLGYLTRATSPAADAADVYQQVLLTTWRRLDAVPWDGPGADEGAALGWLIGTARRCLANHRRAENRRADATERLHAYLLVSPPQTEASDPRVAAAMSRLRPEEREILELTYWDGLGSEHLAAALDIRPDAARKRLERARTAFRAALESQTCVAG